MTSIPNNLEINGNTEENDLNKEDCFPMGNFFIMGTPSAFRFIRLLDIRFTEFIPIIVLILFY